jgi:hypothetical protein
MSYEDVVRAAQSYFYYYIWYVYISSQKPKAVAIYQQTSLKCVPRNQTHVTWWRGKMLSTSWLQFKNNSLQTLYFIYALTTRSSLSFITTIMKNNYCIYWPEKTARDSSWTIHLNPCSCLLTGTDYRYKRVLICIGINYQPFEKNIRTIPLASIELPGPVQIEDVMNFWISKFYMERLTTNIHFLLKFQNSKKRNSQTLDFY